MEVGRCNQVDVGYAGRFGCHKTNQITNHFWRVKLNSSSFDCYLRIRPPSQCKNLHRIQSPPTPRKLFLELMLFLIHASVHVQNHLQADIPDHKNWRYHTQYFILRFCDEISRLYTLVHRARETLNQIPQSFLRNDYRAGLSGGSSESCLQMLCCTCLEKYLFRSKLVFHLVNVHWPTERLQTLVDSACDRRCSNGLA